MTAMPCGKKKHSNATSQSHRTTGPLVAIDETVLRLRMATTNKSAKSHRPSSRRRALVGLALIGQPELSFMVSGRPRVLRQARPFPPDTPSPESRCLLDDRGPAASADLVPEVRAIP